MEEINEITNAAVASENLGQLAVKALLVGVVAGVALWAGNFAVRTAVAKIKDIKSKNDNDK